VKQPWKAGKLLSRKDWAAYRRQVLLDCRDCGVPPSEYFTLARFPLLMEPRTWRELSQMAEKLTREILAGEQELIRRPDLHAALGIPADIRAALSQCNRKGTPRSTARVMRFDFHFTPQGWRITEVNADVVGGFIEGAGMTDLMAAYVPHNATPGNPARAYAQAARKAAGKGAAIVFVRNGLFARYRGIKALAREMRRHGLRPLMRKPGQLNWSAGLAHLVPSHRVGQPGLLIRFVNTDWLPRLHRRSQWTPWFAGGKTPMSNPGTSVLIQSKRLPLIWDKLRSPMPTWRALLPETRCPSELDAATLKGWVLKPVLGRVGVGLAMPGTTEEAKYKKILRQARRDPNGWAAQRLFQSMPVPTPQGPRHICLGIFTIAGRATGAYARMTAKPLVDGYAEEVAVLLRGRG
jgi:glutathionylspermidine synthase